LRKRPLLQMAVFGVVATAVLIAIALLIPWFPKKGSTQAGSIRTLYDVLLIVCIPIFVLVMTVVLFSILRYRMRPGEELKDGPPIHGNTRLEVIWTALPALLILSLCIYSFIVLRQTEDSKPREMTIDVTARQFAFEFTYPEASGKTVVSPELYLAKDQPVVFKLRSYDVIHSFFVPSFSEKLDAVPGIVTTLRVTPTAIGIYPVECTELCGPGHSLMRAAAHVVTPAQFEDWLRAQPANAPPPVGVPPPNSLAPPGANAPVSGPSTGSVSAADTSPAAGKEVFTGSAGCGSCHTLAAAGTSGTVGPNLDERLRTDCATPASKQVRGATLQECIMTAITKPYAYIPSGYQAGVMPSNFSQRLTSTQIQALVNFLASAAK
jgi:cytochrome c oxidase subunit 2